MNQQELELDTEVLEHRKQQREQLVFMSVRLGMRALAERGLRYLALLFVAGLFFYASVEPDTHRTINAALMALVYIVTLFKKGGGDGKS
jgi:hypothetical protein